MNLAEAIFYLWKNPAKRVASSGEGVRLVLAVRGNVLVYVYRSSPSLSTPLTAFSRVQACYLGERTFTSGTFEKLEDLSSPLQDLIAAEKGYDVAKKIVAALDEATRLAGFFHK